MRIAILTVMRPLDNSDRRADEQGEGDRQPKRHIVHIEQRHGIGGHRVNRTDGEVELAGYHEDTDAEGDDPNDRNSFEHERHVCCRNIAEVLRKDQPADNADDLSDYEQGHDVGRRLATEPATPGCQRGCACCQSGRIGQRHRRICWHRLFTRHRNDAGRQPDYAGADVGRCLTTAYDFNTHASGAAADRWVGPGPFLHEAGIVLVDQCTADRHAHP